MGFLGGVAGRLDFSRDFGEWGGDRYGKMTVRL